MEQNKEIYRKRQAIVEHPYGIIKRQWGFYYIMTKKTMEHAAADVGLIFTAFNLRRIMNIIDQDTLKKYLVLLACFFFAYKTHFKRFYGIIFCQENHDEHKKQAFLIALNRLYLTPIKGV